MAVLQSCFAIFICLVLLQLKPTEATHNSLGSPPRFASQHPNVYIFETDENGKRQALILNCSIDTPSPTVNYTWFRGNQELPGSLVNGEGSLVIPNITEGEYASREGIDYYCIASDNIGFDVAVRSRNITVYYARVPGITNTFRDDRDHFVGEESLTYTCQFEGFPLPNITFIFNGAVISSDSGFTVINNSLTIHFLQVSHSGIYQCIVSNEFGDDQQAWLLKTRQPILPTIRPLNFTELDARTLDDRDFDALIVRNNSSNVMFSVDVVADPCPDVVWTFNGTELGPSNSTFMYNNACRVVDGRNSNWTYTLNVVLTLETSGVYSANFTNIAGTALLPRIYFTVPVPISVIGLSLNDTCLKEGSSVSIRCNIRGFPRPRIEFRKSNIKITPEDGIFENILLEFYDQIVIKNVTMKDEGLYSCFVVDGQPLDTQNFDFCSLPRITSVDITSSPLFGEFLFIECTVDGIPQPNTVWMKDGAPLEDNDDRIRTVTISTRKSSRVEITSASIDDNGEYQCMVGNVAGSANHSFIVELIQGKDTITVPSVSATLSLGSIIGITVGVTALIPAALFIVLVSVFLITLYRLYASDKSSKPALSKKPSETMYPLYDTLPYPDPVQVRINEETQINESENVHQKSYEEVQPPEQPLIHATVDDDKEKRGQKSPKTCTKTWDHKSNINVNKLECSANPAYGMHVITMEGSQNYDDVVLQYEVISDVQLPRSRLARSIEQN